MTVIADASAGTVVRLNGEDTDVIILQVWNGEVLVQAAGHHDGEKRRVIRSSITRVVRTPKKDDMHQVAAHYRAPEKADEAEEGAVMATATAKKSTARKTTAKKAATPKAPPAPVGVRLVPNEAMKKAGVVRITGRTEAKQKINFAIVDAVLLKGQEPEAVGKKHGIGAAQVRKIIGLAKGEIDPDRKL